MMGIPSLDKLLLMTHKQTYHTIPYITWHYYYSALHYIALHDTTITITIAMAIAIAITYTTLSYFCIELHYILYSLPLSTLYSFEMISTFFPETTFWNLYNPQKMWAIDHPMLRNAPPRWRHVPITAMIYCCFAILWRAFFPATSNHINIKNQEGVHNLKELCSQSACLWPTEGLPPTRAHRDAQKIAAGKRHN